MHYLHSYTSLCPNSRYPKTTLLVISLLMMYLNKQNTYQWTLWKLRLALFLFNSQYLLSYLKYRLHQINTDMFILSICVAACILYQTMESVRWTCFNKFLNPKIWVKLRIKSVCTLKWCKQPNYLQSKFNNSCFQYAQVSLHTENGTPSRNLAGLRIAVYLASSVTQPRIWPFVPGY